MERFTKSRLFVWLVYIILGLLALYLLILVKPMFMNIYFFLKAILAPFIVAMIISYVLNPVVTMLHERKVPRTMAVLLIYTVFFTALTVLLVNVIPMLAMQVQELNERVPDLTMKAQNFVTDINNTSFLPDSMRDGMNQSLLHMERKLSETLISFCQQYRLGAESVFIAFIVPFLAFYILKDFEVFERTIITYVPKSHRKNTVRLMKDIDAALGSYIRGTISRLSDRRLLAYIGYLIIGMAYALLLAGIVAITNVIPYLGPFFGGDSGDC